MLADGCNEFLAGRAREHEVADDEVEGEIFGLVCGVRVRTWGVRMCVRGVRLQPPLEEQLRLTARERLRAQVAVALKACGDDLVDVGVVLDDQHARSHGAPPFSHDRIKYNRRANEVSPAPCGRRSPRYSKVPMSTSASTVTCVSPLQSMRSVSTLKSRGVIWMSASSASGLMGCALETV